MDSRRFIGRLVTVTVDRPSGSRHPRWPDLVYPVNYGYLAGVPSGDGEDLDAYILGVDQPIEVFTGRCIAVVHRFDDLDDKLIVVHEGCTLIDSEIESAIEFQERYFTSSIVR